MPPLMIILVRVCLCLFGCIVCVFVGEGLRVRDGGGLGGRGRENVCVSGGGQEKSVCVGVSVRLGVLL